MAEPHVFLHTAHPSTARSDHLLFMWMRGGKWGQGAKIQRKWPWFTHRKRPVPITGRSHRAPFLPRYKVSGKHYKNNSPAKHRIQGRGAPLWASSSVFSGHGSTGDAGDTTLFHPPRSWDFPLTRALGLRSCPRALPLGVHTFGTLYTRGANATVSLNNLSQGLAVAPAGLQTASCR